MIKKNYSEKYYIDLDSYTIYFLKVMKDSDLDRLSDYLQHGNTTRLLHSVAVSYYSYKFALYFKASDNIEDLIRGALAHDYFLYDGKDNPSTEWHGSYHPKESLKNARKDFALSEIEEDIIIKHMFPATFSPPKYKESAIVCIVDKACAIYEYFVRKNPYKMLNTYVLLDNGFEYKFEKKLSVMIRFYNRFKKIYSYVLKSVNI